MTLAKYMEVWGAVQRTVLNDADRSGVGPKILLLIANDRYPEWSLIAGGGWLNNFNIGANGDADKDAMTFDLGIIYEFLTDQVYVGFLGSAIDTRIAKITTVVVDGEFDSASAAELKTEYENRLDWSIDAGLVVTF